MMSQSIKGHILIEILTTHPVIDRIDPTTPTTNLQDTMRDPRADTRTERDHQANRDTIRTITDLIIIITTETTLMNTLGSTEAEITM